MLLKHLLPINKNSALFQNQVILISTNKQVHEENTTKKSIFFYC